MRPFVWMYRALPTGLAPRHPTGRCVACGLALVASAPALCSPQNWETRIGFAPGMVGGVQAAALGARPGYHDGYEGGGPYFVDRAAAGIWTLLYRVNGPDWAGQIGFYPYDFESPIPPGGA